MAKGKKTGGRNFPKGWAGGPGRPKMPEDQKIAWQEVQRMRSKHRHDWMSCFEKFVDMPMEQITAFIGTKDAPNTTAPVIELLVARSILRVMSSGKANDFDTLREMMCGPEPKQLQISGPDGEALSSPLAKYNAEELAKAYLELDRLIKEEECKSTQTQPPSSGSPARCSPRSSGTE